MNGHSIVVAMACAATMAWAGRAACQEVASPDSFEVRINVGPPAEEPAGQYVLRVSYRRGGREIGVDSLNSACLDTAETPAPVRDTAALRLRLPALARWYRYRALPDSMGRAMFLYIGLRKLAGPGAAVDRSEADALEALLQEVDPPVLVLTCEPLRVLTVWLRGRSQLLSWMALGPSR